MFKTLINELKRYNDLKEKELDLKTPQLNQPIRVALVGSTKSPSLGLTLSLIGKELSLERIKKALEMTS